MDLFENSLTITQKSHEMEYVPARDAGSLFGYTGDYVARLAREKKIAGRRFGHQWFVNPQSLAEFATEVTKQKILRNDEIKQERKKERHFRHVVENNSSSKEVLAGGVQDTFNLAQAYPSFVLRMRVLAMALGVVLAGGMVGMMAYARPVDEVRNALASALISAQELRLADMHDRLAGVARSVYGHARALENKIPFLRLLAAEAPHGILTEWR